MTTERKEPTSSDSGHCKKGQQFAKLKVYFESLLAIKQSRNEGEQATTLHSEKTTF
jgi:hypothetical protein